MTTLLQRRFEAASDEDYSFTEPNELYHGPSQDLLTCDGICHAPRPACLAALNRVLANSAALAAADSSGTLVWRRMARAVLRKPAHQNGDGGSGSAKSNGIIDTQTSLRNGTASKFAWATPEGALEVMTGTDHPSLTLPPAVRAPFSCDESSGVFHPAWVSEGVGFMTARASGYSFKPCVAVTRITPPDSRVNQISALTGLSVARVGNLASAGLSGMWYLALHRPEEMTGPARSVCAFFNGLPYADELSVADQGGDWAQGLANLAGPLLAAERMLNGFHPKLFERALLGYHCCTIRPTKPSDSYSTSTQTLFLTRFYDSTLPAYLDCFKALDPSSILVARAATWGTTLSNDVFDYVIDGISGRTSNLCWAIGGRDSPVECARMFRGCVLAAAQNTYLTSGGLFALLYMEFVYLYTARYCYYTVPCDLDAPLDDTYIPFSLTEIPVAGTVPVSGFRAAYRAAFSESAGEAKVNGDHDAENMNGSLPPWQGLAATPCEWDDSSDDFDVVSARALHDILGCMDHGIYAQSLGLYRSHLGWLIRQFDALIVSGRDNLGVGRYYAEHSVKDGANVHN